MLGKYIYKYPLLQRIRVRTLGKCGHKISQVA